MAGVSQPSRGGLSLGLAAIALLAACERDKQYYYIEFERFDLVTDPSGGAEPDPNLVEPRGMQVGPTANVWVANAGTGTLTTYTMDGVPLPEAAPRAVTLPVPATLPAGTLSRPSGIVYYGGSELLIQNDERRDSARYLVATEEGTILGYNSTVDEDSALIVVDNSAAGAVYRGITIGRTTAGVHLYATNFAAGTVDVFDGEFAPATDLAPAAFEDQELPSGYAPFGIAQIENLLYVTYAPRAADGRNPEIGPGNGLVNVYRLNGENLGRVATGGPLNAPWGIASTPWSMPYFGRALLVGNHGDGTIHAFDLWSGTTLGPLADSEDAPIVIEGLWDLTVGITYDGYYTLLYSAAPAAGQGAFGQLLTEFVRTEPFEVEER